MPTQILRKVNEYLQMKVLDFVTRNTNWTLSFQGVSAHDVNK